MTTWYVARLAPMATRPAKNRAYRAAREDETVFEQEMAEAGFGYYLPKLRKDCINPRTKKKHVRSLPLFVGYGFVSVPSDSRWPALRACEAVAGVLGTNGRPRPVLGDLVNTLREAEANMVFDDTHASRVRRGQEGRNKRETTAIHFPAGISVTTTDGPFAGYHGMVVSVTGKGLVRVMMKLFGGEVPMDVPADWLEAAE